MEEQNRDNGGLGLGTEPKLGPEGEIDTKRRRLSRPGRKKRRRKRNGLEKSIEREITETV
jgi:hypothetical protein